MSPFIPSPLQLLVKLTNYLLKLPCLTCTSCSLNRVSKATSVMFVIAVRDVQGLSTSIPSRRFRDQVWVLDQVRVRV